jgi:hypothetical protein
MGGAVSAKTKSCKMVTPLRRLPLLSAERPGPSLMRASLPGPKGVPSLGPAGHRRDGVQKPADSQPKATPELEILILLERMRGGRSGTCPVLRQRSEASMVPGYVQGGTRAGPAKCRVERGADGSFGYGEYLFCASARAGSSATAGRKDRPAMVAYAGSGGAGKATAERRQNLLLAAGQTGHATGTHSKG